MTYTPPFFAANCVLSLAWEGVFNSIAVVPPFLLESWSEIGAKVSRVGIEELFTPFNIVGLLMTAFLFLQLRTLAKVGLPSRYVHVVYMRSGVTLRNVARSTECACSLDSY